MKLQYSSLLLLLVSVGAFHSPFLDVFGSQPSVDAFGGLGLFDTFGSGFGIPRQYHYRPPPRHYKFDEDARGHYIFLKAPHAEQKSFELQINHAQGELTIREHASHGFEKTFRVPEYVDTLSITAEWVRRDLLKIVLPKQRLQFERQQQLESQEQLQRQRDAERQQQLQWQRNTERQQQLQRQRDAERQQQLQRQQQAEHQQQLQQQRDAERQQQLQQQRRAEYQQRLQQQRQAERQQQLKHQRRLQQRQQRLRQEQLQRQQQEALRHQRLKRQRQFRQEQLEQQRRQLQQQQRHRLERQQRIEQLEKLQRQDDRHEKRRQPQHGPTKLEPNDNVGVHLENLVPDDHDSDMLVAEDEDADFGEESMKHSSAIHGYVDMRGIFREY